MVMRQPLSFDGVRNFLDTLFGDDLHAKRVKSLAGATLGAIQSASLAVGLIGQGLALARGRLTKHAVKQVDRLLSNQGIDVDALLGHWVPYVVGKRDSITVAMDWTEFDADGQATIMLSLLSRHGRATPLVWLTVDKAALKNRRNGYEYQVLVRLAEILPADVRVRVVADRGFGDHKLYRVLTEELKFDFVIRFRGNIAVTATSGEARAAADWVGAGGRARTLRRGGYRRGVSGRHRGLRAGEGHERARGALRPAPPTFSLWHGDDAAHRTVYNCLTATVRKPLTRYGAQRTLSRPGCPRLRSDRPRRSLRPAAGW